MVIPPIIPDPETQGCRPHNEPVPLARMLALILAAVVFVLFIAVLVTARTPTDLVLGLLLWILVAIDVAGVLRRAWS